MSSTRKLDRYRRRRDFRRTAEPRGRARKRAGAEPAFVIQKHDARNLHYDFRLEVDDVLRSWAVPKGLSTDPREKRLAMPTEDHPLDYVDFEGVIAAGEYGAGAVLVWDAGTYRELHDREGESASIAAALDDGHAAVWLEGSKLRGGYTLQRIATGEEERWLIIKRRDEGADARRNPLKTQPESVLSAMTIEQIAATGND